MSSEVLQGLSLENLFIINVSNLQNVFTQVAAAVRQNAAEIQAMQDLFAALQSDHDSKKQLDKALHLEMKNEIQSVRDLIKTLVTGSDVHELRFSMEQKQKALEDSLFKVREDSTIALEEIGGLRGEVIKHETGIGNCRRDLDKLRQEYNQSSSGLDYKLENLDNKFSNFVNNTSALVTKEELKGKVKDEVQSLRREIEEMHKATAEVHGQLQKRLNDLMEGEFEEVKQAVPELRESIQELMKNTTTATADVKGIKVFLDSQGKILKELQDSIESKADKNSLEDVVETLQTSASQSLQKQLSSSSSSSSEHGPAEAAAPAPTYSAGSAGPSGYTPSSTGPTGSSGSNNGSNGPTSSEPVPGQLPKRPLTPLSFSTVAQSNQGYSGGTPPEIPPANFSNFFVAQQPEEDQKSPKKTEDGPFLSIVSDTVDVPSPELLSREIKEVQRQCVDLRKDLSDLAGLVEVLTSELKKVKEKDQTNGEVWHALDLHTQQLAHLLHTKADLSNVDHALSHREVPKLPGFSAPNQEEMDNLRNAVNSKAGRDELRKMKRVLQKELEKTVRDNMALNGIGDVPPDGTALVTRSHYRCLACDRLIWRININNISKPGAPAQPNDSKFLPNPHYDIAPNIAWRRSQVKDLVGNKHDKTSVNAIVAALGGTQPLAPTTTHTHTHPHPHNKSPAKPRTGTPVGAGVPLPPISSPTQTRNNTASPVKELERTRTSIDASADEV